MRNTQKLVIKLTNEKNKKVLIGLNSLISIEKIDGKPDQYMYGFTRIRLQAAMVDTFYVVESVEEIYELINNK